MKNNDKKSFIENYISYRLAVLFIVIIITIVAVVYQNLFN